MKHEMFIEYLKCRAHLNFEVYFGLNGAIGAIVAKWDLILFRQWIILVYNIIILLNTNHMHLNDLLYCSSETKSTCM